MYPRPLVVGAACAALFALAQPPDARAVRCEKMAVKFHPGGFHGMTPQGTIYITGSLGRLDPLGDDLALVERDGDPKTRYPLEIVRPPAEFHVGDVTILRPKAPLPAGKKYAFTSKMARTTGALTTPSWKLKPVPKRKKSFKPLKLTAKQTRKTDGPYVWRYQYSRQFKLEPKLPVKFAIAQVTERKPSKNGKRMRRWIPVFMGSSLTFDNGQCAGSWPMTGPSKQVLDVEFFDRAGTVIGTTTLTLELPPYKKK